MAYSWEELDLLAEQWQRVFGAELVTGALVTPDQVPIVRRCIREESMGPLNDWIASEIDAGHVY